MYWIFLILNIAAAFFLTIWGIPYSNYTYINEDENKADFLRYALIAVYSF